jgi:hypothetical protein
MAKGQSTKIEGARRNWTEKSLAYLASAKQVIAHFVRLLAAHTQADLLSTRRRVGY